MFHLPPSEGHCQFHPNSIKMNLANVSLFHCFRRGVRHLCVIYFIGC